MGITTNSDLEWEKWGQRDPYFAVLTSDDYRSANLSDESRQAFFRQGEEDVASVMTLCRKRIDPGFAPRRVLDFGCGVGRMAVAFAKSAEEVVGVDVSPSMLEEARANIERLGVDNVRLETTDGLHLPFDEQFDLVYSYIVLQHVPPERGIVLFKQLLRAAAPGGIGAIQLTYSRTKYAGRDGLAHESRAWRSFKRSFKRFSRFCRGKNKPLMEMNAYDLNQVFFCLQSAGIGDAHVEFTDHGGYLGVFICFRADS